MPFSVFISRSWIALTQRQASEPFTKFTSLKKGAFRIISFLVYRDYELEPLNETVDAEVEALPEDMRARLVACLKTPNFLPAPII
jgi:hypothetical protein